MEEEDKLGRGGCVGVAGVTVPFGARYVAMVLMAGRLSLSWLS